MANTGSSPRLALDWLLRTDEDHACALIRIDELICCPPDTPESHELQLLTILVEDWELRHTPIGRDEETRALEKQEADLLRGRMYDLLKNTANGLKGKPKPLHMHSIHDLPEVAATMRRLLLSWQDLQPKIDRLAELVGAEGGEEPLSRAIAEIEGFRRRVASGDRT